MFKPILHPWRMGGDCKYLQLVSCDAVSLKLMSNKCDEHRITADQPDIGRQTTSTCHHLHQLTSLNTFHQVTTLFCVKWRHGRDLGSMTSLSKSDSVKRCVFTWRTIVSNFTPIRSETTQPCTFLKTVAPTTTRRKRRVAIWNKFLI